MKLNFRLPALEGTETGGTGGADAAATAAAAAAAATAAAAAAKGADGKGGKDGQAAADTGKGGKDGTATPEPKAPDKYELKLPDGGRLGERDLKAIEKIARENNWSNEDAQAAINDQDAFALTQSTEYLSELTADKDYGGEKLAQSQKLARFVIDHVRPAGHARRESFLKFINRGGSGNNIEVVSFLADLGKQMAEDGATGGKGGGGGEKSAETVLYDKTPAG